MEMKHSFLINMLGLFFGILGVAALGSVDLSVSATLMTLPLSGFLFVTAGALLSIGLAPKKRPVRRNPADRARKVPANAVVYRRAA